MKLAKIRELLAHGIAIWALAGYCGLELSLFAVVATFKNPEPCCNGGSVLPAK
jgi:hypothetical protein